MNIVKNCRRVSMHKILTFVAENLVAVVSVTVLTGATVTTSVMGVAKVARTFGQAKLEVPNELKTDAASSSSESVSSSSSSARLVQIESVSTVEKADGGPPDPPISTLTPSPAPESGSVAGQSVHFPPRSDKATANKDKKVFRDEDHAEEAQARQE